MTVKEINVFEHTIIDLVNKYNEGQRIVNGLLKGNANLASDICECTMSKIETLTTTLRYCDVIINCRYDISGLIFRIDVRYHDTHKEYKANSHFRINY